jgi:hypothetical protein
LYLVVNQPNNTNVSPAIKWPGHFDPGPSVVVSALPIAARDALIFASACIAIGPISWNCTI